VWQTTHSVNRVLRKAKITNRKPKLSPTEEKWNLKPFFFLYLLVHMLLQNYNVYRLNFYNYPICLLSFCGLVLSRRLLAFLLNSSRGHPLVFRCDAMIRLSVVFIIIGTALLIYLLVNLILKYTLRHLLFLLTPLIFYFLPFRCWKRPPSRQLLFPMLLSTSTTSTSSKLTASTVTTTNSPNLLATTTSPSSTTKSPINSPRNSNATPSFPSSTSISPIDKDQYPAFFQIHSDQILYNMKHVLYDTFESSYYASFIPLKFLLNEYLVYDYMRSTLVVCFVSFNCLVMLFVNELLTNFREIRVVYSLPLLINEINNDINNKTNSKNTNAENGNVDNKRHSFKTSHTSKKCLFGFCKYNPAESYHIVHCFFFFLFVNPERTHTWLIGLQLTTITVLFFITINSHTWIVYGIMLMFNYAILFLCIYTRRQNLPYFDATTIPHHKPLAVD